VRRRRIVGRGLRVMTAIPSRAGGVDELSTPIAVNSCRRFDGPLKERRSAAEVGRPSWPA
jgi:hypothetical protein